MKKLSVYFLLAIIFAMQSFAQTVWDGSATYDWYTTNDGSSPYEIATPEDFAGFSNIVNGTDGQTMDHFTGKTVMLTADIYMNEDGFSSDLASALQFTPIGNNNAEDFDASPTNYFAGTFNGNYHYIYNVYIKKALNPGTTEMNSNRYYAQAGLFGAVNGTVVMQNVIVKNMYIEGSRVIGSIVGYYIGNLTLTNCMSINFTYYTTSTASWTMSRTAALVGGTNSAGSNIIMNNCGATGGDILPDWAGALVGQVKNSTISNCYFYGYTGENRIAGNDGTRTWTNNYIGNTAPSPISTDNYGTTIWTGATAQTNMQNNAAFVTQLGAGWRTDGDNVNNGFPVPFLLDADCLPITDLHATSNTNNAIDVAWTAPAPAPSSYNVMWGTTGFLPINGSEDPNYIGSDFTTDPYYSLSGLDEATGYVIAIQSDCGGSLSPWITLATGTTADETYGEEIWHGYVYSSPGARQFGNDYLGYVEENPTFNFNAGSGAWGSATRPSATVWVGSAPSDNIAVRYKMKTVLPCGAWTFTVGNDDHVRISVDGGATWLPFTNSGAQDANGWSTANGDFTTSTPITADGSTEYFFVFEFTEGGGGAIARFTPNTALVPVTVDNTTLTPNSFDMTFGGTELVNYFVSDIAETDPDSPEGNVVDQDYSFDPAGGAVTVVNLDPSTTYHIYVQTDCGGAWNHVTVITPNSCAVPTSVAFDQNTNTLTWLGYGMSGWNIKVSTTSIDPATATADVLNNGTSSSPEFAVPCLQAGQTYYFYVQADCGSAWVSKSYGNYCIPTTGGTNYYLTTVTTTGGIQNISNTGTQGAYHNFTNMAAAQVAGGTLSMQLSTSSSTHTFRGYVDWNQDGDFDDANETVFNQGSYVYSYTGTINIPAATPLGSYRLRVSNNYLSTNTPCSVNSYGSFHDYTLIVFPSGATCMPVLGLAASNITDQSAVLGWTASSSAPANGYEIYYSTDCTPPDEFTAPSEYATVNAAPVSGLLPNTTYFAWVRASCENGYSTWFSQMSFTTLPTCLLPSSFSISNRTHESATVSWTGSANASNYYIEYGPTATFVVNSGENATSSSETTIDLSGLDMLTQYTIAVKTDCGGDGESQWATSTFWTLPVETFGDGIWHGYVYNSPGGTASFGEYLGYVEQLTPQFSIANTSNAWTGSNPIWANGTGGPLDNFTVRYKMTYDFPCGNYTINLPSIDDQARLSVDGGATWIIPGVWGSTSMTGSWSGSAFLNGPTDLVLDFYENGGGAGVSINWTIANLNITVNGITGYSANVTIAGGNENSNYEYVLGENGVITNPDDETPVAQTGNLFTLSDLNPATQYNLWVRTECSDGSGAWTQVNFTTTASCIAVPSLAVSNTGMNTTDINFVPLPNATTYTVEWGPQSFTPGTGAETGSAIITAAELPYQITGLTAATQYKVAVLADCGTPSQGPWATVNFNTERCEVDNQCTYTFTASNGDYYNFYSGGHIYITQNGIDVWHQDIPNMNNYQMNWSMTQTITLCKNQPVVVDFIGNAYLSQYYGYASFTIRDNNNTTVATATNGVCNTSFMVTEDCSACFPATATASNQTETSFNVNIGAGVTSWDLKVSSFPIDPINETGDLVNEESILGSSYLVDGLEGSTIYYVYVRNHGACWSGVIHMSTEMEETFGEGEWHGYVYHSPAARTFSTTYLGYVTEPEQFDRNVGGNAWAGATAAWVGAAPVDNIAVRYLMKKDFPCGNYTFNVGTDDYVRLSVDSGATWLTYQNYTNTQNGWTMDNGQRTTTPTYLEGETYLVYEFTEGGGGAQCLFQLTGIAPGLSITNLGATTADINITGAESYNIKVSTVSLTNPTAGYGDFVDDYNQTALPFPLSGLEPLTTYYVYVQTDCGGPWGSTSFTTLATCEIATQLAAIEITHNSALIKWLAPVENVSSFAVAWGAAATFNANDPSTFESSISSITDTFTTIDLANPMTAYKVAVQTDCGGNGASDWTTPISFTSTADETYGDGFWHGYVYAQIANTGKTYGNYLGYVEEPAQFQRNYTTTNDPWSGVNPVWVSPAPSDYFSARYRMTYNFPGNNYVFHIEGDDVFRLSVDGGQTWLPFTRNDINWTTPANNYWTDACCSPSWHSAPIEITGSNDLVLEMSETYGGAYLNFSFVNLDCQAPTNITATNITMTDADISWTGNDDAVDYTVEICAPGELPGAGNIYSNANATSPISISGLLSAATIYTVYVKSNCAGDESSWATTTFNTPICNPTDQCNYTLTLGLNSYGYASDWSGTRIDIQQAGIQAFTTGTMSSMNNGTVLTMSLCKNLPSEVVVVSTGTYYSTYTNWQLKNSLGETVASKGSGTTISPSPNFTAVCPTCMPVTNVSASNITTTSADIAWTSDGTDFEIEYKPQSVAWTDPSVVADVSTGSPYSISGLDPSSYYSVRIRKICNPGGLIENEDFSTWTTYNFVTNCDDVPNSQIGFSEETGWTGTAVLPTAEAGTFNGLQGGGDCQGTAPNCWSVSANCTYGTAGSNYPRAELNSTTHYMIMPPLASDVEMANLKMKIWIRSDNAATSLRIFTTTGADLTGIELLTTIEGGQGSSFPGTSVPYVMREVDLGAFYATLGATGTRIGFSPSGNRVDIYKVVIWKDVPPTCPAPTAITTTNVTDNSATVSWTAGDAETEWAVQYRVQGTTPWTAVSPNPTTNSCDLTGLNATTTYDVQVMAICDPGVDESVWTQIVNFTTPCAPITVPHTESFSNNASNWMPDCWYAFKDGAYITPGNNANFMAGSSTGAPGQGRGFRLYANYNVGILVSPTFDVDVNNLAVSYWSQRENDLSSSMSVGYLTDPADASSFVAVQTFTSTDDYPAGDAYQWTEFNVNLSSVPAGIKHVAWKHALNGGVQGTASWYWLDEIAFDYGSAPCDAPTNVTASATTQTTATVSWTGSASALSYTVEYKPTSSPTWSAPITVTAPAVTTGLTGLSADTEYDVRVKSICADNESGYATTTFTTPEPCYTPTALAHNTVTDNSANITWIAGGTETQWQVAWKTSAGSTWSYASVSTNPAHSLTSLNDQTQYDVKVRAVCAAEDSSEWTAVHNFTTLAPAACASPVVSVSSITQTGASVTWTAGGTETQWALEYGTGTNYGAQIFITTQPYPLSSLQPNTTYNVRLRAICGAGDTSYYSNVATFTTLPLPCVDPTNVLVSAIAQTTATVSWTASATAVSYKVQYKPTASPTWSPEITVMAPAVTTGLTGLDPYTQYDVQVKSICNGNESGYATTTFTTLPLPCVDPTNVIASAIAQTTATVSWTGSASAVSYTVEYKLTADATWDNAPINVTAPAVTTGLTGLDPYTQYDVRVKSICNGNESGYATTSFTTLQIPCDAPTNLIAPTVNEHSITVAWTPMNGETNWKISWKNLSSGNEESGSGDVSNNAYIGYPIIELVDSTLYQICVKAVCAPGVESDSTCINVMTEDEVGIHNITLTNGLQLYPNPTTGELRITNYELREGDKIEVYNILGQTQPFSILNPQQITIDVSHLAAGIYTVKIGGYVGKFVKR